MSRLVNLYNITEMARTRDEPTWRMLDWCAQQTKPFTIKDMERAYNAAGGRSTGGSFATLANHFVAKYDPNATKEKHRADKYKLSSSRPIVYAKRGFVGKGGAATYEWGLDGPLRPISADSDDRSWSHSDEDDTPINKILDTLETKLGANVVKAALKRWRTMHDVNRIAIDIKATIPKPLQMDALHVATEHLVDSGEADEDDVKAAEDEVTPPEKEATPFNSPQPKIKQPAPVSSPDSEDDDEDLGPGWTKVPNEDGPTDDDEEPDDESSGHPANFDKREYPAYLPDPDDQGDKYENAMFRIVSETDFDEYNPIWEKLKAAKDQIDAQNIIRASKVPTNLQRSAMIVAKAIFDNTGRDWETGKKFESRLLSLYVMSESTVDDDVPNPEKRPILGPTRQLPDYGMDEAQLDPVDFAPRSGLKRITHSEE